MVSALGYPSEAIFKNAKRIDRLRQLKSCDIKDNIDNSNIDDLLEGQDMNMIDFVRKCVCWDKELRISAEAALLHPWIRKPTST